MQLNNARVFVNDLAAAKSFYAQALGLPVQADGERFGHGVFKAGSAELVVESVAADAPDDERVLVGRFTGLSFTVSDIQGHVAGLEGQGGDRFLMKTPMNKLGCLLLVSLVLSACASGPDALEPRQLDKASTAEVLQIKAISLRDDQIALAAGEYTAELEDANGTFYRGTGRCFRVIKDTYEGGIYITRRNPVPVYQLYYYKTPNATLLENGQTQQIASNTAPQAGIVTGAVGGALGGAIVGYMQTMNDGKLMRLRPIEADYTRLVTRLRPPGAKP